MDEAVAKTKWCPMVRFNIGPEDAKWQGVAFNNRGEHGESCSCIGSECAVWIEDKELFDEGMCGLCRGI